MGVKVFPLVNEPDSFRKFFFESIQNGWVDVGASVDGASVDGVSADGDQSFDAESIEAVSQAAVGEGISLVAYAKVGLLDGKHAYNPWLQELPDPVSKVTWDNYACIGPGAAAIGDVAHQ